MILDHYDPLVVGVKLIFMASTTAVIELARSKVRCSFAHMNRIKSRTFRTFVGYALMLYRRLDPTDAATYGKQWRCGRSANVARLANPAAIVRGAATRQ